ncbi:MAG: hypothetical protein NT070_18075 [Cyanobacteria bacterium]|nr:hypothetical protein [Cyanobacteriota bacterium]
MRFKHFASLEPGSNCVVEAVKLNPNSVLGLIILEQNASGDEYNTKVEQDLDDGCYQGTLQDVYEQCKGMMQKYQLGALFTGSPRIPVEDARCGLKAIDNPREFRLLEIAYTH